MKPGEFYLNRLADNTVNDRMDSFDRESGANLPEISIQNENKYRCMLKCEGNKTYHKPGYCPDCNVKLALVGNNSDYH